MQMRPRDEICERLTDKGGKPSRRALIGYICVFLSLQEELRTTASPEADVGSGVPFIWRCWAVCGPSMEGALRDQPWD